MRAASVRKIVPLKKTSLKCAVLRGDKIVSMSFRGAISSCFELLRGKHSGFLCNDAMKQKARYYGTFNSPSEFLLESKEDFNT